MNEITNHGFNFGSMKVTRVCEDNGVAIINVKTGKGELSIRATKTGQLRFFVGSQECEVVDKNYMKQLEESHG